LAGCLVFDLRVLSVALLCCGANAALAGPPDTLTTGAIKPGPEAPAATGMQMPPPLRPSLPLSGGSDLALSPLAGRTLVVSAEDQISLNPHEVILTFDDGPSASYTPKVLDILDSYGIKATFLMVGKMAELHPGAAREVALDGHTIGTHTYDHANLAKLIPAAAFDEVRHGQEAVATVLAPVGATPSPFFRFPYLATTWPLKATLTMGGTIPLGVQIDSDDYLKDSPKQTLAHLLARLDRVGKGIVLFHDIHAKTLLVLPAFLDALAARGYTIVHLAATTPSPFDQPLVTATR
jgi:peptidoglycan/xylan/chitin deacetylase (PgdA/CDA1 family)